MNNRITNQQALETQRFSRIQKWLAVIAILAGILLPAYADEMPGNPERFSAAADDQVGYLVNTANGQVWLSTDPDFTVPKKAVAGKPGRFKIVASRSGAFVIDTASGKVWKSTDPDFKPPKKIQAAR